MKIALLALVVVVACSDHDRDQQQRESERQHRVIDPPVKGVRALPPHAIRADGVGPYRLGASLGELLDQLPSGPRIAQFDIPNVVHRSVLRAEDDAILIGGEPQGKATFVAVVGGEVARTESGIHIGSTRDELARNLGAPVDEPDRAWDPRVVVPSGMRELHAMFDNDRVVGLVVTATEAAPQEPAVEATCTRPIVPPSDDPKRVSHTFGACLTASGELVTLDGDDLGVRAPDSEKVVSTHIPNAVFAVPLRAPDGRDEIIVVIRIDDAAARTWFLTALRFDGTHLVRVLDPTPAQIYQLTATNARWIGADLHDLDIAVSLASRADMIEVGGLLTTRIVRAGETIDRLRDLVVISPVHIPRHHPRAGAPEGGDAGAPHP